MLFVDLNTISTMKPIGKLHNLGATLCNLDIGLPHKQTAESLDLKVTPPRGWSPPGLCAQLPLSPHCTPMTAFPRHQENSIVKDVDDTTIIDSIINTVSWYQVVIRNLSELCKESNLLLNVTKNKKLIAIF